MEPDQNHQSIMAAGEEVARIMQSPVFNQAYADTINEMTREVFDTPPGHTKTLEEIRRRGSALTQVMNNFRLYYQRALAASQPQQNSTGPDEHQGFNTPQ